MSLGFLVEVYKRSFWVLVGVRRGSGDDQGLVVFHFSF